MTKSPYPHQLRSHTLLRLAARKGHRRIILVLPTGAGKTYIAGLIFSSAVQEGRRCLFLAHRRELLFQSKETFERDFGLTTGMILSGQPSVPLAQVQVASKATIAARTLRRGEGILDRYDVVIVDECHLSMAREYLHILETSSTGGIVIGLTATPARHTGTPMGNWWEEIVIPVQYQELIHANLLVPTQCFAPHVPDMTGVSAMDWETMGAARLDTNQLVGDVYTHWLSLAEDRATIGFANTVAHSVHLTKQFRKAGIAAEHVDGNTPKEERDIIWDSLAAGRLQVVWNCNVASEGIDVPRVSAVILACPTRSIVRYRQRAGRSMRPYPQKDKCILIDHSGCCLQFGFPDQDIPWSLTCTGGVKPYESHLATTPDQQICPNCFAMFYGSRCPNCGHSRPRRAREVAMKRGLLKKVERGEKAQGITAKDISNAWFRCRITQIRRGGTVKAACGMFKSLVGLWPSEVRPPLRDVPQYKDLNKLAVEFWPYLDKKRAAAT